MIPIGQLLNKTLTTLPKAKRIKGQLVIDAWSEVVGEIITQKTEAFSFTNGILFVRVCDSVWAQHLVLQKKQIISKLKRLAKTKLLKDIHFQVGQLQPKEQPPPIQQERQSWRQFTLDQQDALSIDNSFTQVDLPPDLASSMKTLFVTQRKRMKWLLANGTPSCKRCGLPLIKTAEESYCLCSKWEDNG